jgi:pimeloyl-ACP methyl ester carboxylesterase
MRTAVLAAVLVAFLLAACGSSGESPGSANSALSSDVPLTTTAPNPSPATTTSGAPSAEPAWTEQDVTFPFGSDRLFGVMTWPSGAGPHPAIVLLSGSGDTAGIRAGATARTFVDHSRRLATAGFAVLRYDPPGVGRSSGGGVIPSLEARTEETHAAIQYLHSLPEIAADRIGLQGWSQGPWVMAMTAVRYPQDVAFLVSMVGSGQSVAKQQVYGIGAQSRAAGLSEEDVAKAVLFGRLLIDWQLAEPIFEDANRVDSHSLGEGAWTSFAQLLYGSDEVGPVERLRAGLEILRSVRDEPWAAALYLDLYLARLEGRAADITPEEVAALQAVVADNLLTDPKDFLTQVRVPLLAFFGEDDPNVDSQTSPALFEQYLTEAGNEDYTIVVIPDVGHDVGLATPGYWNTLSEWLSGRFSR